MLSSAPVPTATLRRFWPLILVGWACLVLSINLLGNSDRRPLDEHEIFVARTATEMARRGDWIVPYFAGQPRLQKLPLNYWLAAAAATALGQSPADRVDAFAARLPSAVAGALLVLVTAWLTYLATQSYEAALVAAVLIGTSNGLVAWSHNARPEMVYATLCGVQIASFAAAVSAVRSGRRPTLWSLFGWIAAAAATMSKGPHYPLFLVVSVAVAAWVQTRSWRALWQVLRPDIGLLVSGVLIGSYLVALDRRLDGLWAFWYREMFYRTGGVQGIVWFFRFYYVGAIVQLTLPWSLIALCGLIWPARRLSTVPPAAAVAWCSVVIPALILSCSRGQRFYYLLPSLAPCIAVGVYVGWQLIRSRAWLLGRPLPVAALLRVHYAVILVVAIFVLWRSGYYYRLGLLDHRQLVAAIGISLSAAIVSVLLWWRRREQLLHRVAAAIGLLVVSYAVGCLTGVFWSTDRYRRAALARQLSQHLTRAIPVYALTGRIEHLVYYDVPVRRVTHAEMRWLKRQRDAYVLADERCPKCRRLLLDAPVLTEFIDGEHRIALRLVAATSRVADRAGAAAMQASR